MDEKKIINQLKKLIGWSKSAKGKKRIMEDFPKRIKMVKNDNKSFLHQIKLMYQYFTDPTTSKAKKGLIGAGLLYFVMPFDVVNDFIPLLGLVDDGVAIAFVWKIMQRELEQYEQQTDGVIDITDYVEVVETDNLDD